MKARILSFFVLAMGRHFPGVLRFLAYRYPAEAYRWKALVILMNDPRCRAWLASIENPSRTRRGFQICTLTGDATSDWIKLFGQHEVWTERFILDHLRADTTFLDIGANIGYFSLLAASSGRINVVAFEPQRQIAALLRQSVRHNQMESTVRVEQLALSNQPATMKMTSCPGNTGHAQMIAADVADAQEDTVAVVVLDDWIGLNPVGKVSVCKIDTEGAEYHVLAGMARLLERDGPALVVEVIEDHLAQFGSSSSQVMDLIKAHGYRDVSTSYGDASDPNRYFVKD